MEHAAPKVSVLIPNWNGRKFLGMVLPSLKNQTFQDFETIVVDNGSEDDSLAYLKSWPSVRVIALPQNEGFAKAVNKAARQAHGTYLALLNNDIEADSSWLKELVSVAEQHGDVGFVATKMLHYDNRELIDEAGKDLYEYGVDYPRGKDMPDDGYDTDSTVLIGCGGALLVPRDVWEAQEGLDERYYFYYEDADLCLRIHLAGYHGYFAARARVYHVGAGSAGRTSPFTVRNMTRNQLLLLWKNMPYRTMFKLFPKLAFHQLRFALHQFRNRNGWAYVRGVASFVVAWPRTLWAHHQVAKNRKISAADFERLLRRGYPWKSRFIKEVE
jgi:GT2 family glycosyltransferase